MKLIRITANGLPLFKGELDLTFYAQQRVCEEDKNILLPLFSNVYLNPTNAFVGVNASGKTSVLKLILLVLDLLNNKPLNHIKSKDVLENTQRAVLNAYFYAADGNIPKFTVHNASIFHRIKVFFLFNFHIEFTHFFVL